MIYEFDGMIPNISKSAYISDSATVIGNVFIGDNCYVGPGSIIRADDSENPIIIGAGSAIEDGVIIHVGGTKNGCRIGTNVTIGHGAIVHCKELKNNANVGMGAILSLYSEVGEHSVIAEGSVVKKSQIIPARVVAGGVPVRIIRDLSENDIEFWRKSNNCYLELTQKLLNGLLKIID